MYVQALCEFQSKMYAQGEITATKYNEKKEQILNFNPCKFRRLLTCKNVPSNRTFCRNAHANTHKFIVNRWINKQYVFPLVALHYCAYKRTIPTVNSYQCKVCNRANTFKIYAYKYTYRYEFTFVRQHWGLIFNRLKIES